MKRFFKIFFILSLPFFSYGQILEDFSDGDLTNNPTWQGDTDKFIVNTDQEMQLNDAGAGAARIYLETTIADSAVWEAKINLDFAPSGANRLQVFLQYSNADFTGGSGYYLEIGENGSDDAIRFFRADNGTPTLLASATDGRMSSDPATANIRMTRTASSLWTLAVDYNLGTDFEEEFTLTDATYTQSNFTFFGFDCLYSSTRSDRFFFDDIKIDELIPDRIAPTLLNASPLSETELELTFDESLDPVTTNQVNNYQLDNGGGTPASALLDAGDNRKVLLTFSIPFISQQLYAITSSGISDLNGNQAGDQSTTFTFVRVEVAEPFDLLITEIMADPTPSIGLPSEEFVEIYNRSDKLLSLKDFIIADGSKEVLLPDTIIFPGEYIVLHEADDNFDVFGKNIPLDDFPGLGNTRDLVYLQSADGTLLHAVDYDISWYGSSSKSDGGWTLEMINTEAPCLLSENWTASTDPKGGTPSNVNSVQNDNTEVLPLEVLRIFPLTPTSVQVDFNQSLDITQAELIDNYRVDNNAVIDVSIGNGFVVNSVTISLMDDLVPSEINTLMIADDLTDCGGISSGILTATFALPEIAEANDILINEVLVDPQTGGKRFVELFNQSDKIVDVISLIFAERDTAGLIDDARPVERNYLLFPDSFVVITPSPSDVDQRYIVANPKALIESDIPSYPSKAGDIVVYTINNGETVIVDEFSYTEDYHHPFLDDTDGVSLERISTDISTQLSSNWQSAAANIGFATPTAPNSQRRTTPAQSGTSVFSIENNRFSPDEDGFEDFLLIDYQKAPVDATANIRIFDADGRFIFQLAQNELLATEGSFKWEGQTSEGLMARMGIYIVWIELFSPDGTVEREKKTCVLAKQLE